MRDDIGPDFESGEDARDHFPQGHFVGCGNCGFAVDVSVVVLQHSELILSMLMEVIERADTAELVRAIGLTRGSIDETMRAKAFDAHEHHELGQLYNLTLTRPRRSAPDPSKEKARRRRRS